MSNRPREDDPRQTNPAGLPAWKAQGGSAPTDSFAAEGFSYDAPAAAELGDGFERSLRRRLLSVPVPERFGERLLSDIIRQMEADHRSEAMPGDGDWTGQSSPAIAAASPPGWGSRGNWSRRHWLRWSAAALAGGTAAAVAVLFSRRSPVARPIEAGELMEAAGLLFESQEQLFGTGIALADRRPGEPYRFSRDLRGRDIRWRAVVLLDRSAVAFDVRSPAEDAATLFALAETVAGLPRTAPSRPLLRTSRTAVSAWYDAPLTYVLAVQGDAAAYRRFLVPFGPVA
ncbi:MAG: hypothetical protein ACUVQQ_05725 [Thermogutta sp.]